LSLIVNVGKYENVLEQVERVADGHVRSGALQSIFLVKGYLDTVQTVFTLQPLFFSGERFQSFRGA
jgi:hypothetical protein